jgi:hypothetical protein
MPYLIIESKTWSTGSKIWNELHVVGEFNEYDRALNHAQQLQQTVGRNSEPFSTKPNYSYTIYTEAVQNKIIAPPTVDYCLDRIKAFAQQVRNANNIENTLFAAEQMHIWSRQLIDSQTYWQSESQKEHSK